MSTWRSWSGLTTVEAVREVSPHDADDVVEAVQEARDQGLRLKMPGTGHSFTDIAATDGVLLRPNGLRGITAVDRDAMTVTALAGTPLHELNEHLTRLGLSLHNMGDIDQQTVAGAISTGTHGTGGRKASLSAQVVGLDLVTGEGKILSATREENPDVLDLARLGLGALGVLTCVTFEVEPLFTLAAHEAPSTWDEFLAEADEHVASNDHYEAYWFPHTDRLLTKRNNRTSAEPEPLSRLRGWFDDEFLANRVYGWANRLGNRAPSLIPRINRLSAGALGAREYSGVPHTVFTSPRRVVFREMEYAVPREVGLTALREARDVIERNGWRISFPIEIRFAPGDDVPLSAAHERDTTYLAFHTNQRTDHTAYFAGIEEVMRAHGGRPHWGKLHSRSAADLAPAYPRFEEFVAMRDRLDPERLFTNAYLDRVLGP